MKRVLFLMVAFAFVGTAAMAQFEQKGYKKEPGRVGQKNKG
jgi:hypothetical protein